MNELVFFALLGAVGALSLVTLVVVVIKVVKDLKKSEVKEQKEFDAELELLRQKNREKFQDFRFSAGDVHGHIVALEWKELYIKGQSVTYDSFYEFIEMEYRQNRALTPYEYDELVSMEDILADCRQRGTVAPVSTEEKGKRTVIKTDDYGTLVKYRSNQIINITDRMAVCILENQARGREGEVFIKEIHVSRDGLKGNGSEAASTTIYNINSKEGVRNVKWANAFQRNIEGKRGVWENELAELKELKEEIEHWNKHRDLVEFDKNRGIWLVTPPTSDETVEVEEEVVEKEIPVVSEEKEVESTPTVQSIMDDMGTLPQDEFIKLVKTLAAAIKHDEALEQERVAASSEEDTE